MLTVLELEENCVQENDMKKVVLYKSISGGLRQTEGKRPETRK